MSVAGYEGFVPEITPLHRPFWDSVRDHQAKLQRCTRCHKFCFIPMEMCTCGSLEWTWEPIAGTGEVYTYTVVHRAPTPYYQHMAPYVIAHVSLPEGPRMTSHVVGCAPEEVRVGLPVRIIYEDVTPELTLYRFAPA
jgi:uncharacterized protein